MAIFLLMLGAAILAAATVWFLYKIQIDNLQEQLKQMKRVIDIAELDKNNKTNTDELRKKTEHLTAENALLRQTIERLEKDNSLLIKEYQNLKIEFLNDVAEHRTDELRL